MTKSDKHCYSGVTTMYLGRYMDTNLPWSQPIVKWFTTDLNESADRRSLVDGPLTFRKPPLRDHRRPRSLTKSDDVAVRVELGGRPAINRGWIRSDRYRTVGCRIGIASSVQSLTYYWGDCMWPMSVQGQNRHLVDDSLDIPASLNKVGPWY